MVTITISGFKTKEQAIEWLDQYEGSVEQDFILEEGTPHICDMKPYNAEMILFKQNDNKTNFNLILK